METHTHTQMQKMRQSSSRKTVRINKHLQVKTSTTGSIKQQTSSAVDICPELTDCCIEIYQGRSTDVATEGPAAKGLDTPFSRIQEL